MALDGNYTDTADARAERRRRPEAEVTRVLSPQSSVLSPATAPSPSRGKRVSPEQEKEAVRRKRRIDALEEKIASQEKEIEVIETRLWEEGLDLGPVESRRLAQEKAKRREELEALVDEWATLSSDETPAGSTSTR